MLYNLESVHIPVAYGLNCQIPNLVDSGRVVVAVFSGGESCAVLGCANFTKAVPEIVLAMQAMGNSAAGQLLSKGRTLPGTDIIASAVVLAEKNNQIKDGQFVFKEDFLDTQAPAVSQIYIAGKNVCRLCRGHQRVSRHRREKRIGAGEVNHTS